MSRYYKQAGTSLIEVMVAVLVSAVGVLGAALLQMNAVKFNQTANSRSTAVFLASDISDRMRANRPDALSGNYDLELDSDAPDGDEIFQLDLQEWVSELQSRLPLGDGGISRDGNTFTIVVQWDEKRVSASREADSGNAESFTFITRL
ncbi:type IV pilus modification protein PilV [Spongiibacter sp. KMU-158]|uniref:Type IV pilus modification protein PilV n=1 Tax=Spongiibacter pelagi TaxID=2760804 RepID=A0A927BZZ5_9GAMM|nr:type IV pilus modification protein PilV [Spongiibacter pelagi]MBD2858718.1 type IV pilus modification protein PilV [Spongiibacter pelagi]